MKPRQEKALQSRHRTANRREPPLKRGPNPEMNPELIMIVSSTHSSEADHKSDPQSNARQGPDRKLLPGWSSENPEPEEPNRQYFH